MRAGMVAFSLGILSMVLLTPAEAGFVSSIISWLLIPVILLALTRPHGQRFRYLMIILCYLAGFFWSIWLLGEYFAKQLPEELETLTLQVTGTVQGIPAVQQGKSRFDFQVDHLEVTGTGWAGRVRLNWYDAPLLKPGEVWKLTVRLRRVHGFASPGAMDYEARLAREGIHAVGYVLRGERQSDQSTSAELDNLRFRLGQHFNTLPEPGGGMLRALLTGDRQGISAAQWRVLGQTGTAHLVVISGLHIALLAGLGYWLTTVLVRFGLLPVLCPLPQLGALAGILLAIGYALLAGFGLPVQRALIMLAVALSGQVLGLAFRSSTLLLAAFTLVLAFEPLAFTCRGFWYSFFAVAALLLGMTARPGLRPGWLYSQYLVFIVLAPLLATGMQPVSWLAPLVNLIAIPLIGLFVVPALMFSVTVSVMFPETGRILLSLLAEGVSYGFSGLEAVAALPLSGHLLPVPDMTAMLLALTGSLLLILPRGLGLFWPALLFFLPWLCPLNPRLDEGCVRLTQLDVGQGLAAAIQTRNHLLLYDTGDRFSDTFSASGAVVLPFMANRHINKIDMLMVSHADRDHSGGIDDIFQNIRPDRILAGMPERLPVLFNARQCKAGQQWLWDNVHFEVLSGGSEGTANDRSCVLLVRSPHGRLLLTGDITRKREQWLLEQYPDLQADVLLVPHHGSRSSSSAGFLDQLKPQLALVSAGYRNRFGHPSAAVMDRMKQRGICVLNSAGHGTVDVLLQDAAITVSAQRIHDAHLWQGLAAPIVDEVCHPFLVR